MEELKSIVLEMLNKGQQIDQIEEILKIEEEALADIIIDLDTGGFVILQDKQWIITKKGIDIFKEREEKLKKLKIEYLHGDINREEYDIRKRELDDLLRISYFTNETIKTDMIIPKIIEQYTEKIICPNCEIENKPGANYCRKCGNMLKKL